jgi:UDP-N-acetylmuramate-alanine ligase
VERHTLNIDPRKIERAITKKTRAIMPVHLMGKPADMDAVNRLAKKHGLYVVEDAAEAHGAVYKGRNVGTLGDLAAYSTYIAHIITTIEGGIVTTDREDFAEVLRSLRSHGRACKCKVCVVNSCGAFCDKRLKFVHYRPRTAILNNLEFDHADIFADLAAIETQFHHLVRTIPASGRIVANAREDSLKRVIERGCWSELEWFSDAAQWSVATGASEAEAVFSLGAVEQGRAEMPLAGSHNRENALAAIAAARHVGVTPAQSIASLARFRGIKRRLELRGVVNGISVIP